MTPEEKFTNDLWHVLKRIRERALYTGYGKPIIYSIIQGFFGSPSNSEEEEILEKLHEWKIITLEEQNGEFGANGADEERVFVIKTVNPSFSSLYKLFENASKEKIDPNRLFRLRQELITPTGEDHELSFELWRLTKSDNSSKKKGVPSLTTLKLTNIQFIYGLSEENRSKIKRIIELILNKVELVKINRLIGGSNISIPIKALEKEGYSLSEAELLIDAIDGIAESSFIKVNKHIDRGVSVAVMLPGGYNPRPLEDLYIILKNATPLKQIKEHIEAFEKKLAEATLKSSGPSQKAIEKKLKILEELKEEWHLAPKKNQHPTALGGSYIYLEPAGEVKISDRKFSRWMKECDMDWFDLEKLLNFFQEEGVITNFETHDEYE